MTFLSFNLF